MREKSKAKLKESEYLNRKRELKIQKENERTVYPMMWKRMSLGSQSRVREEEEFRDAYLSLDCVMLWTLIRRTHLTHVFGDTDPMKEVNMQEQESRYAALRQGEREYIGTFKMRFDEQVSANDGVGVPPISESKRALEFILKLDQNRYRKMVAQMRNDALRCVVDAYPKTLASAFRVASQWTNEETVKQAGVAGNNSAYVTEEALVTKARDPEKGSTKSSKFKKKVTDPLTIRCYVCGEYGHFARECALKKSPVEKVLVTSADAEDKDEPECDEWGVALVTDHDAVMFSRFEVLLDNEASLNIFNNRELLTGIRKSLKPINVSGIQRGGGVSVDQEGDFGELGRVYYSKLASANILSFASQIDSGATIRYDHNMDSFTLQPYRSSGIYRFGRKNLPGGEGRFYSCDWRNMGVEAVMVTTVKQNSMAFTKREIERARVAREMLARMGFPTVEQAISIINSGSNFEITTRDFQIADAIWGKDIASLKGKTSKRATESADITVKSRVVQKDQVLAIDIMFIDKMALLVGIATPLGLTIATSLNTSDLKKASRAAATIKKAILYFVGVLASQDFKTAVIMSDGEGAISNLVTDLQTLGIEVDISGAGGHVARIERRIRVIKERVRAHVSYHLPFTSTLR